MRRHHLILILLILLVNQNTQGQKLDKLLNVQYKAGFVVLDSGDTLRGGFEFNDCEQNYRLLVYIDPLSAVKQAYEPQEVEFFMLDSLVFMPKELKDGWVFVRLLIYDQLKVYLYKRFFTSNTGSGVENQIMYEKSDGKYLLVSFDNFFPFKSRVGDFFRDDHELYQKIDNNTYSKKDVFKIASDYNDWLRQTNKY